MAFKMLHSYHIIFLIILICPFGYDGHIIGKRQAPNDFVNNVFNMFNLNSDGGPAQMFTNLFLTLMNQTTSVVAPLLGMAPGDPLAVFNGIMQQFMAIFGQFTGLWSNTVSRQMDMWSSALNPEQETEFDMVNKSVSDLTVAQHEVEKLSLLATVRNEKAFRESAFRARQKMDDVWKCIDGRVQPYVLVRQPLFPRRPLTPGEIGQLTLQYQGEVINLWRKISDRIVYDMGNPNAHHPSACCCRKTDGNGGVIFEGASSTSSPRTPANGEIEFDNARRDSRT